MFVFLIYLVVKTCFVGLLDATFTSNENELSSCPMKSVAIVGGTKLKSLKNIASWDLCAKKCLSFENCNYWMLLKKGGVCNFFSNYKQLKKWGSSTSGKRNCQLLDPASEASGVLPNLY